MERPNFYLLLELPYDPPETDEAVIAQAIRDKTNEWNRNANNAQRALEVNENRALLPEIKRIMLESPQERLNEAKQAKTRVHKQQKQTEQAKVQEMKRAVTILCLSENVTEAGLYAIAEQTGIAYEQVLAHVPKNITVKKESPKEQGPSRQMDEVKMTKMANNLAHLQINPTIGQVVTLYDFLDLAEDTDRQKIVDLAGKMYNDLLRKPKSAKADAQKELYSYVKTIFNDDLERKKYDYTIQLMRFAQIESLIDILGNQGVINSGAFNQLKVHAVEQGLMETQAEALLKAYCQRKNYSLFLQQDTSGPTRTKVVKCGHCLHLNEADATRCQKCGGALQITCMSCQKTSPSTAKSCVKCGQSFAQMTKYSELLKKGKEALVARKLAEAEEHFLKAKLLVETAEVEQLLHKVTDQQDQLKYIIATATELVEQKKYYQAEALLKQLSVITADQTVAEPLQQRITHMQKALDEQYTSIMQLPLTERVQPIVDVLARCVDCPWALTMISTLPPLPATDFSIEISDKKVLMNWMPAEPDVTYKIYRTELEKPSRLLDGQLIAETNATHAMDEHVEPNVKYWYSLYTYRGTIRAQKVSVFGPMMRHLEVEQFELSLNNLVVQMKWALPADAPFILVKAAGEAPKTIHEGTIIAKGYGNTFKDMDVEDGQEYGYTIFTYSDKNGQHIISNGVSKQITVIDVKPVQQLAVNYEEDSVRLNWENDQQLEVRLYRSAEPFTYQKGQCVPLEELTSTLKQETVKNVRVNDATLEQLAGAGEYILAVSIAEQLAMIGECVFVKRVEKIRQLDIQGTKQGIKLSFEWPSDVQSVVIHYDEEPIEGQKSANQLVLDKQTYYNNEGANIATPPNAAYYFAVFSRFEKDGDYYLSEAEQGYFSTASPSKMLYTIEKKGFLKKKYYLVLRLESGQKVLPGLIVVKKRGSQPLNAADGQVITQLAPTIVERLDALNIEFSGDTLRFDLTAHSGSNVHLRIFFQSNNDAKRFILEPIGKLEIK